MNIPKNEYTKETHLFCNNLNEKNLICADSCFGIVAFETFMNKPVPLKILYFENN